MRNVGLSLTKPCTYCGSPVTITDEEENSLVTRRINLVTVRVSCPSCSDKKIQAMYSEDS
ncbi:MAG: hypothetical protein ACREAZ_01985 [Nitrososphaera sp.]